MVWQVETARRQGTAGTGKATEWRGSEIGSKGKAMQGDVMLWRITVLIGNEMEKRGEQCAA